MTEPSDLTVIVPEDHLVQHTKFSKLSLALWGLVIIAGVVLEALGLISDSDSWPPLTQVIVAYLPAGLTMAFIGWLKTHFSEAYNV